MFSLDQIMTCHCHPDGKAHDNNGNIHITTNTKGSITSEPDKNDPDYIVFRIDYDTRWIFESFGHQ